MKISIELSDTRLTDIDQLAARLGISHGELFARALTQFIKAHTSKTTRALNEIYAIESSDVDPVMWEIQINSMPNDKW